MLANQRIWCTIVCMVAIRRVTAVGVLCALVFVLASCGPTKHVSIDDVHVSPVTSADVQKAIHDPAAKAVLVNVWATWCGPCREEFPGLVRVAEKYNGQGLKVILVSADETTDVAAVKKFLADEGVIADVDLKLFEFADTAEAAWKIIREFHKL